MDVHYCFEQDTPHRVVSRTGEQRSSGGGWKLTRIHRLCLPKCSICDDAIKPASSGGEGPSSSPPLNTFVSWERGTIAPATTPVRRIAWPVPPNGCLEVHWKGSRTPSPLKRAGERLGGVGTAPDRRGHAPCPRHRGLEEAEAVHDDICPQLGWEWSKVKSPTRRKCVPTYVSLIFTLYIHTRTHYTRQVQYARRLSRKHNTKVPAPTRISCPSWRPTCTDTSLTH